MSRLKLSAEVCVTGVALLAAREARAQTDTMCTESTYCQQYVNEYSAGTTASALVGAAEYEGNYGVQGQGANGVGVYGNDNSGGCGVQGYSGNSTASFKYNSNSGVGVYGESNIVAVAGYGNTSGAVGVFGYGSGSQTSGSAGVVAQSGTSSGNALFAYAGSAGDPLVSATIVAAADTYVGIYGITSGSSASGISGHNDATSCTSSDGHGVYGTTACSGSAGVDGNNSNGGIGVNGTSSDSGGYGGSFSGYTYGVYGTSTNGDAGHFVASTSGFFGASGTNSSSTGNGVYGANTSTGIGVYGVTNGGSAIATGTYAIYGNSGISGTAGTGGSSGYYAGYFVGPVRVTGDLYCGGGCSSDERLKRDIKPLSAKSALDEMLRLHGTTFEWIDPAAHRNHTGTQVGVIAQDVQKVEPQWIGEDGNGFMTVDPDARTMVALTVESFRAILEETTALRARAEKAEARIDNLENGAHPIAASFTSGLGLSPGNLGVGLLSMLGCYVVSRRRREENAQG